MHSAGDGLRGPFTGRFNNDGERIELSNCNGEIIISFRYNDARPWPSSPDGTGHSLILAKLGTQHLYRRHTGRACSQPLWCGGMDLDHSGRVDIGDLAELAEQWLAGASP